MMRLADIKPGTVFIKKNSFDDGFYYCLKLADQKALNLMTFSLFRSVDQNEEVELYPGTLTLEREQ